MIKLVTIWTAEKNLPPVNAIRYEGEIYSLSGVKLPKGTFVSSGWHFSFCVEFGFFYRKWISKMIGHDKAYGYSRTYGTKNMRANFPKD